MKRNRVAEIHFYEWRIAAWAISETRDRLNAAGRGIYRELLDQCYGQGKFPDDPEWICRRCACTVEEYEKAWKVISRHFPKLDGTEYRYNVRADMVRGEYFAYVEKQRASRRCRDDKPHETNDMHYGRTTLQGNVVNGGATNGNGNGNGNGNDNDNGKKEPPKPPAAPIGDGLFDTPPPQVTTDAPTPTDHQSVVRPDAPTPTPVSATGPLKTLGRRARTTEQIRKSLEQSERWKWWQEFWAIYPCHEGMNEAMDAFDRKITTREIAVAAYHGAQRYRARIEADIAAGREPPKLKYGQGWINRERWLDEEATGPLVVPQRKLTLVEQAKAMRAQRNATAGLAGKVVRDGTR
jgi:hypothetical protein